MLMQHIVDLKEGNGGKGGNAWVRSCLYAGLVGFKWQC